jgi:hypothetical protein
MGDMIALTLCTCVKESERKGTLVPRQLLSDILWWIKCGQHFSSLTALATMRYQYKTGTTDEQMAAVCVSNRKWAELNPHAFFRKPLTIEEVMSSKMLSRPLRAKMSNMLFDGGEAFIVSSAERAPDVVEKPVYILGEGGLNTHFVFRPLERLDRASPIDSNFAQDQRNDPFPSGPWRLEQQTMQRFTEKRPVSIAFRAGCDRLPTDRHRPGDRPHDPVQSRSRPQHLLTV